MTISNCLMMVALLIWGKKALSGSLVQGICVMIGLFVLLPRTFRIETSGSLPEITFSRILLLIVLFAWLGRASMRIPVSSLPFLKVLIAVVVTGFVSLVFSSTPLTSLKWFLSLVFEGFIFYIIIGTSVVAFDDIQKVMKSITVGLFIVAVLGIIQKYAGVNIGGEGLGANALSSDIRGIEATYPHRILLGYAMCMGFPLVLATLANTNSYRDKTCCWIIMLSMMATCYLATSRGPWLGMAIAISSMAILGNSLIRKTSFALLFLALLGVSFDSGIRNTIINLLSSSLNSDSLTGSSYEYRWQLWTVAWNEIIKSPTTLLFGDGPLSTQTMDFSSSFTSAGQGNTAILGYSSWDNQYASDLIELGCVGLVVELYLYFKVLRLLVVAWRKSGGKQRILLAGIISSVVVYLFAMETVYMFSPQLKFLFLTLLGIGPNVLNSLKVDDANPLQSVQNKRVVDQAVFG